MGAEEWVVSKSEPALQDTPINKLHIFILLMYGVVLTYPALSTGYIPSHDVLIHLLWSSQFTDQLWSGNFYPRWLSGMNGGFGSPAFIFYGPIPYYFTALLRPLLGADPEGWHQLGVAAALAVLISGVTAYAWLRTLSNETGALIGALLYMSAPYHLACDLYERFAFAELWAFIWLPLVMLMVHRVVAGHRIAVVGLALCYGALVMTHLPTTMIFSWIPLLYAAWHSGRKQWAANSGLTLLGMVCGMGMAAIYVIPALLTQQNVSFAAMREDHFFYGYNFLYYGPRYSQEFADVVATQGRYAGLMLLATAVAIIFGYFGHGKTGKQQALFWMVVALATFAMMLPIAQPIWDALPILQAIQFPWRFNILLILAGSAAVALGMQAASARGQGWKMLVLLGVCVYVMAPTWRATAVYQMLSRTPGQASFHKIAQQFGAIRAEVLEKVRAAKLRLDVAEYRPKWVPSELLSSSSVFEKKNSLRNLPKAVGGWIDLQTQGPGRIELTTHALTTAWIPIHQFYYPNWTAHIDGNKERLPTRPSVIDGRLEVQVPPGVQHVMVKFEPSRDERIGQAVSLVSLVLLLVLAKLFKDRPLLSTGRPS